MSIQKIIQSLEQLINIHDKLIAISKEKTETIKMNQIEQLQKLIIQERKLVQNLEKVEQRRKQAVEEWFSTQSLPLHDPTITKLLDNIEDNQEKTELEQYTIRLTEAIIELKNQEQLNQALIQQSIQFVQLSMDLIHPTITNMNYGETSREIPKQSVFDSKA